MNLNVVCSITLFCALAVIVAAAVFLRVKLTSKNKRRGNLRNPVFILLAALFVAGVLMFLPVYLVGYFDKGGFESAFKAVALSIHNTMRLFILDGEFDAIRDLMLSDGVYPWLSVCYSVFSAAMYVVAPVMTVGFVLSFFKSATARLRYIFCLKKEVYYMTELNSHSLLLAENAVGDKNAAIVFLNCENADEELINRARSLKAICLKADINEIPLKKRNDVLRKIYFISTDENLNLDSALALIGRLRKTDCDNAKTQMYVFATGKESELLLNSADNGDMKVRRINAGRNFVLYGVLRDNPVFDGAIEEDGVKNINILVVGMGHYGTEMVKSVCWLAQMPGYKVTVHAFDVKENLSDIIASKAPEFIKFNGKKIKGEAQYDIVFHGGVDVNSDSFRAELAKAGKVTAAYTMLGSDALNIETAIKIREEFGRLNIEKNYPVPSIYAVVKSSEQNSTISGNGELLSETGKSYGIRLIGDEKTEYSVDVIERQDLEKKALACHMRWAETDKAKAESALKFEKYEYYRRASMAEALYSELRLKLGFTLDGAEDKEILKEYEHRRWNAFMRSEGYVFALTRDDIAKTHPSLVAYQELSKKEKDKDEVVLSASETKK